MRWITTIHWFPTKASELKIYWPFNCLSIKELHVAYKPRTCGNFLATGTTSTRHMKSVSYNRPIQPICVIIELYRAIYALYVDQLYV